MTFVWRVATNGYRWNSETAQDDDPKLAVNSEWSYREYQPLEEFSGLFRTFADTPLTRAGVLSFAQQYGLLGWWQRIDGADAIDCLDMESFAFWCEQVQRMQRCVSTWDAAQKDMGTEQATEEMRATVTNNLIGRVRVAFTRNRSVGGFVLEILPINLIGGLWLQLAETIAGRKKHRACKACGRWFEISPQMYRKSRVYCSEACKSQGYRERKELALRLADEGKTVKEIAAELGSDAKTVKGWLRLARRSPR